VLAAVLKPGARIAWLGPKIIWDGAAGEAARKGAQAGKFSLHPVLIPLPVSRSTIRRAFADMAGAKYHGVLISPAVELSPFRDAIAELAVVRGLPSLGGSRAWAEAGALLGYGTDVDHNFRRIAHFVDQILKGAQPGTLPIENPTKIDLTINLETAKSLNMAIPPSLLARADRVIE
jgi:putative ABC transport system substrate-binding protein